MPTLPELLLVLFIVVMIYGSTRLGRLGDKLGSLWRRR